VFVCASTECFPGLSLPDACGRLVDLEYSAVEVAIQEQGGVMTPAEVHADLEGAYERVRQTHRLAIAAFRVEIAGDGKLAYEQFESCCKLAKACKVVTIVVPSAELGTPFNAEIERLQELVRIAALESAVVALQTQAGCMTQDPDTAAVLCKHVKGLGITLDPSHFIFGPHQGRPYDKVMPHVQHVHLRDTRKDKFHVQVGQGEIEYSKLVVSLQRVQYHRALCVHIPPLDNVDHTGELRKMRLLLDSFL
jgi:sugar phosphate isomerase/epimerase